MEPEGSFPHSVLATCLYPEPAQSSPYPYIPPAHLTLATTQAISGHNRLLLPATTVRQEGLGQCVPVYHTTTLYPQTLRIHSPMKMEKTLFPKRRLLNTMSHFISTLPWRWNRLCSETSAIKHHVTLHIHPPMKMGKTVCRNVGY
jgi:hypothetical protein